MIEYVVGEKAITIKDSYLVEDDAEKLAFLQTLCLENEGLELCRSIKSMLIEWKAHNILYKRRLFTARTKDTDLEYGQNWLVALGYRIICAFLHE